MQDSTRFVGVITGDIVSSTSARAQGLVQEALSRGLDDVSGSNHDDIIRSFSVYRGDEFQGVTTPVAALRVALEIRMNLLAGFRELGEKKLDVRMGVGVGRADFLGESSGKSLGEVFLWSGRAVDKLSALSSEKRRLMIRTPWESFNRALVPQCALFDALASRWSGRQSQTAGLALREGGTERQIGAMLGISQPSVHGHLAASGFWAVEKFIEYYEQSVRELVSGEEQPHG